MKEVTRQMRKRGFGRVGKIPTLCWFCQNAVPDNDGHGCEWSRHGNPVDGWDVMPSRLRNYRVKIRSSNGLKGSIMQNGNDCIEH